MKTWFALTLLLVGFVTASAQDTLQVNSDTVTKKFENERVRVLESVLKVKENAHSHPRMRDRRKASKPTSMGRPPDLRLISSSAISFMYRSPIIT